MLDSEWFCKNVLPPTATDEAKQVATEVYEALSGIKNKTVSRECKLLVSQMIKLMTIPFPAAVGDDDISELLLAGREVVIKKLACDMRTTDIKALTLMAGGIANKEDKKCQ